VCKVTRISIGREAEIETRRIEVWEAEVADAEARRIAGILLEVARAEQSVDGAAQLLAPVLRRLTRPQRESVAALLQDLASCPSASAQDAGGPPPGRAR
jgi:hypothetical protein